MTNNDFDMDEEDMIAMPELEQTETEKMQELENRLESLIEELEDLAGDIEALDGDKLSEEWENNPEDEGYSSDAPVEFACAIRYAVEQLEGRYDNL